MNLFLLFIHLFTMNHVLCFLWNTRSRVSTRNRPREAFNLFNSISNFVSEENQGVYIVDKMPELLPSLKNSYYLLRHGQSWGNVEGVISSARSLATSEKHGLTPLGLEQATESSQRLFNLIMNEEQKPYRVFFYTSPFSRARQTAQACLQGLKNIKTEGCIIHNDLIIHYGLMERYFGRLDNQAIHTYAYVWPVDMFDVTHTAFDVESVAAVATRLRETILSIDTHPIHKEGDIIVLVSHADVLQILQLYAAGAENVGIFSSYRFANGEVRRMGRSTDTLPSPQPLSPPKIGT